VRAGMPDPSRSARMRVLAHDSTSPSMIESGRYPSADNRAGRRVRSLRPCGTSGERRSGSAMRHWDRRGERETHGLAALIAAGRRPVRIRQHRTPGLVVSWASAVTNSCWLDTRTVRRWAYGWITLFLVHQSDSSRRSTRRRSLHGPIGDVSRATRNAGGGEVWQQYRPRRRR